MIKITDTAAEQIRAANNNPDVFEMILRVAAYQEDDGSVNYGMVLTPSERTTSTSSSTASSS